MADDIQKLQDRGATVLGYVPVNGLMISVNPMLPLDGLGIVWSGPLRASDKISAILPGAAPAKVLLELHPDADLGQARALVLAAGAAITEVPDLKSRHLLVTATPGQIQQLAADDSVAYVFPAAGELADGRPLAACGGAMTVFGSVGQYTATAGTGWDGAGLGHAALTYTWDTLTPQLAAEATRAEVRRAFQQWADVVQVTFTETTGKSLLRNINVLFARLDHGDGYPFDGRGGVLAHTFYPAPVTAEPLAGDMHLDDDEAWRIGVDTDVFSVALHEAGHALGLGHSDNPNSVMYPYYRRVTSLTADDIGAIRTLYAATGGGAAPAGPLIVTVDPVAGSTTASTIVLRGTVTGGTGTLAEQASTDRGWSDTASGAVFLFNVALAEGDNELTLTVSDSASSVVRLFKINRTTAAAKAPVTVRITGPAAVSAYTTSASSITVNGTAEQSSGIQSVVWANSTGSSGNAAGTTTWNTGPVPLAAGPNAISIVATANDGSTGTASITVTSSPAEVDKTPPSLAITSPANVVSATSNSTLVVSGTAADNVGVARITWSTGAGDIGEATGTTAWKTSPIPLYPGYNTIIVRAFDAAGNSSWKSVQVTRR